MNKQKLLRTFASILVLVGAIGILYYFRSETPLPQNETAGIPPGNGTEVGVPGAPLARIATEKKTGRQFVSNELIVEFTPSLSEADALAIIASAGGEMIARTVAMPVFRVRVGADSGDGSETIKTVTRLENNVKVIHAELNYLTTIETPTGQAPE